MPRSSRFDIEGGRDRYPLEINANALPNDEIKSIKKKFHIKLPKFGKKKKEQVLKFYI
jgi:hypothetical protein